MYRLCLLRLLLCLVPILVGLWAGAPVRADAPAATSTTLPYITSKNGQALVRIWVFSAAKKPIRATFLVDSGSDFSAVSDTLADTLGLPRQPATSTGGRPFRLNGKPAQAVILPALLIGTLPANDSQFVILSDKALSASVGQPVDGILGAGVFEVYPVLFDFQRGQTTFFSSSPLPDDLKMLGMDDAAVAPVRDHNGDYDFMCRVALTAGGKTVEEEMLIDTGAAFSLISAKTADRLKLEPISEISGITTLFGHRVVFDALVPSVSVGTVTVPRLVVSYPRDRPQPNDKSTLGLNFLSQFRVLLDYKQKKMYLKPLAAYARIIQIRPSPPAGDAVDPAPKQP